MNKIWLLLIVPLLLVSCASFICVRPMDFTDGNSGWELDCRDKNNGAALCWKKAVILCDGVKHTKTVSTNGKGYLVVKCER